MYKSAAALKATPSQNEMIPRRVDRDVANRNALRLVERVDDGVCDVFRRMARIGASALTH